MLSKIVTGALSFVSASAVSSIAARTDGGTLLDAETGSRLACHLMANDLTVFELEGIDTDTGAYSSADNKLKFQYCSYIEGTETFAKYNTATSASAPAAWTFLTDNDYIPRVETVKDTANTDGGENNIIGVKISRDSETPCAADETLTNSFQSTILCDESVTGSAQIVSYNADEDTCAVMVTVRHKSGCYKWSADSYITWVSNNPTWVGLIGMILGGFIAFRGKRWFPFYSATCAALFMIELVFLISAAKGWMESKHGVEMTIFVGVILAIPVGVFFRKYLGLALGLNGVMFGICAGCLAYCVILAVLGWASWQAFLMFIGICAIAGGMAAFEFGWQMVVYGTSFVGSYFFMRGCTLVFSDMWSGFPNEHEIFAKVKAGENIEDEFVAWQFWAYVALFVAMFLYSSNYQKTKEQEHEDLDTYDGYKRFQPGNEVY